MPVIPEYDAKETIDPGSRSMPRPDFATPDLSAGMAQGKALAGVGGAIGEVAAHAEKRRAELESFTDGVNLKRGIERQRFQDQEAMQSMPENGAGWAKSRLDAFDANVPKILEGVSPANRERYAQQLQLERDRFATKYSEQEVRQRTTFVNGEISRSADGAQKQAYQNPQALAELKASLREQINSAPITAAEKADKLRAVDGLLEESAIRGLAATDPKAAQKALGVGVAGAADAVVTRIIGVESGNNPNAQNPNSTAGGLGQFIDSTWLSMMKKYKPQVTDGKSDSEIIALKRDGNLSREMVRHYAEENAGVLRSAGLPATQGNIYLAHFLGPAGAVKVLSVDPGTPVAQIVGDAAVAANRSILEGKTAGEVAAWAAKKMGGSAGQVVAPSGDPQYQNIPYARRLALASDFDSQALQAQAKQQAALNAENAAKVNQLQLNIMDGKAGLADVQAARDAGWLTDAGEVSKVMQAIARRDQSVADVNAFNQAIASPGFAWNKVDAQHKSMAEAGFQSMGGSMEALQTVFDKTGMVPESAAKSLRGSLSSNNPQTVLNAMTVASNIMARNPTAFTGVAGANEIEQNAVSFRHYVERLGLSPAQAAQRIVTEQSPEYQASVRTRVKNEDVDAIVKKNLSIDDLSSMFNEGLPIIGRPNVEFAPRTRLGMFSDYAEVFRDFYMQNGDVNLSKELAAGQLRKLWGTTFVSGSMRGNLMRYPPEKAPAYQGIPNVGALVAQQAIADIKASTGQDVQRDKLSIMPVPNGQTARAFWSGEPVPYTLSWVDKNGHVQTLNPGNAFVADPQAMRDAVTNERKAGLERGQAVAGQIYDRREQNQAVKRRMQDEARQRIEDTRRQVEGGSLAGN